MHEYGDSSAAATAQLDFDLLLMDPEVAVSRSSTATVVEAASMGVTREAMKFKKQATAHTADSQATQDMKSEASSSKSLFEAALNMKKTDTKVSNNALPKSDVTESALLGRERHQDMNVNNSRATNSSMPRTSETTSALKYDGRNKHYATHVSASAVGQMLHKELHSDSMLAWQPHHHRSAVKIQVSASLRTSQCIYHQVWHFMCFLKHRKARRSALMVARTIYTYYGMCMCMFTCTASACSGPSIL